MIELGFFFRFKRYSLRSVQIAQRPVEQAVTGGPKSMRGGFLIGTVLSAVGVSPYSKKESERLAVIGIL